MAEPVAGFVGFAAAAERLDYGVEAAVVVLPVPVDGGSDGSLYFGDEGGVSDGLTGGVLDGEAFPVGGCQEAGEGDDVGVLGCSQGGVVEVKVPAGAVEAFKVPVDVVAVVAAVCPIVEDRAGPVEGVKDGAAGPCRRMRRWWCLLAWMISEGR